jgi:hypothetical protein
MAIKRETWSTLPRQSKLASCMFPDLVPEHIRDEMQAISRLEGRVSPLDAKVAREQARRQQQQPKRR